MERWDFCLLYLTLIPHIYLTFHRTFTLPYIILQATLIGKYVTETMTVIVLST